MTIKKITILLGLVVFGLYATIAIGENEKIEKPAQPQVSKKYTTAGEYPYYEEGDVLPEGSFPPIETHTNSMMAFIASSAARKFMDENSIDNVTATETTFSMMGEFIKEYEKDFAEYNIARYFHRADTDEKLRYENIKSLADNYAAVTRLAAIDSLEGSPLLLKGKAFVMDMTLAAGIAVKKHIELLNDDAALQRFTQVHAKDLNDQRKIQEKRRLRSSGAKQQK